MLLAAITLDNTASALVLGYRIVTGQVSNNPAVLLGSGGAVFVTNIIVFGIWYWKIDLGGPLGRAGADARAGSRVHRLSLCELHQRGVVLTHLHHASDAAGQGADGPAVRPLSTLVLVVARTVNVL